MNLFARYVVGDALTVLRGMPDASVDLVLTSPPFLALRAYLPADHPDKGLEVGSEMTPGAYIDRLLDVVEECRRVLAPHGSLAIELGDTYAGSGGSGGDYNIGGMREGQARWQGTAAVQRTALANGQSSHSPWRGRREGFPLDKGLTLVPELLRFTLAYGFNPLTGRETEPWRIRNVVRWCRPNPSVGALGDKFRPATTDMVVACVSRRRYFDLDAVRNHNHPERFHEGTSPFKSRVNGSLRGAGSDGDAGYRSTRGERPWNLGGAPPLDWWLIATEPYKGAHYATWPRDLLVTPIEAMCPRRVCQVCGKPSERIVGRSERYAAARAAIGDFNQRDRTQGVSGSRSILSRAAGGDITSAENVTLGWTDCGHDAWRRGVVLDPFAGSGTTLAVASGLGRSSIGIDLDGRNLNLARERVGMFLETEEAGHP